MVNCKDCKNHLIDGNIVVCKIIKAPIPESCIERFECSCYKEMDSLEKTFKQIEEFDMSKLFEVEE